MLVDGILQNIKCAAQHSKFLFWIRDGIVAEREIAHRSVDVAARFRILYLVVIPDIACRLPKEQTHFPEEAGRVSHAQDSTVIVQCHGTVIERAHQQIAIFFLARIDNQRGVDLVMHTIVRLFGQTGKRVVKLGKICDLLGRGI